MTGGAGYIGSCLVRQLLDAGHDVRIVDTFQYSDVVEVPTTGPATQLHAIRGDVRNPDPAWFEGVDAVAHLAGISNDPTADLDHAVNHDVNVIGTMAVAECAIEAGIDRFTFASSASVYDDGTTGDPATKYEHDNAPAIGAYSLSKLIAERELLHPRVAGALKPIILRQGTVYGLAPRMRFDLVVNAMTRDAVVKGKIVVHGAEKLWRPMLSVEGCVAVHVAALTSEWNVGPRIVNVVDQNEDVLSIAKRVKRAVDGLRLSLSPVWIEVVPMPAERRVRNYRVDAVEWRDALGPQPIDELEEQVTAITRWLNVEARRDSSFDPYAAKFENLASIKAAAEAAV